MTSIVMQFSETGWCDREVNVTFSAAELPTDLYRHCMSGINDMDEVYFTTLHVLNVSTSTLMQYMCNAKREKIKICTKRNIFLLWPLCKNRLICQQPAVQLCQGNPLPENKRFSVSSHLFVIVWVSCVCLWVHRQTNLRVWSRCFIVSIYLFADKRGSGESFKQACKLCVIKRSSKGKRMLLLLDVYVFSLGWTPSHTAM